MLTDLKPCRWRLAPDDYDRDMWDSDCGESWVFTEGGPVENKMRFCCGCGKPLKASRMKADDAR